LIVIVAALPSSFVPARSLAQTRRAAARMPASTALPVPLLAAHLRVPSELPALVPALLSCLQSISRDPQVPVEPTLPTTLALDPGPSELALGLRPAPLESTDLRFPINLATALRLSDARPLLVAAAQASVWIAEAQLTRAKVLWVPTLMIGADYIRHDGGVPDINKGVMTAPSVNFFYGGPGLWYMVNLSDIIFQALVQRQILNSRQADIQTAKNDSLFQTADAYFMVHQYRGMYAGSLLHPARARPGRPDRTSQPRIRAHRRS
jgi:hypothetical protein